MGQQISAAAESVGHPNAHHAHMAVGDAQVKSDGGVDPGKAHQRRGQWGPTAAVVAVSAKVDTGGGGGGGGEKNINKSDPEVGRMSIRAAIDSFIENCLSSSNEFSDKNGSGGEEVDTISVLGRLKEESRAARGSNPPNPRARISLENSKSGEGSISSDGTDIQEVDMHADDAEEKQLVIDCDDGSQMQGNNEAEEPSHHNGLSPVADSNENVKELSKEATESANSERKSFSMYLQDRIKKSGLDQQENVAQLAQSKDLQLHSQIIMWETAKKPADEAPITSRPGGSEFSHGPVRLQTLIDKVLDKSLNNQASELSEQSAEQNSQAERTGRSAEQNSQAERTGRSAEWKGQSADFLDYYHKIKKEDQVIVLDTDDEKVKEVIPKDKSQLGKKEPSPTVDLKDNDIKQIKSTLCFKDHIEKVLMESFLSYEEEERRDALKRGENPDVVPKPLLRIETDDERQSAKKELAKPGVDGTISVQDIVDRVISQTEVISKLLTPSTSEGSHPTEALSVSQTHPPLKYVSTHTKALEAAQRFAVQREHQSSNIGRKRGRPRLGSPGMRAAKDSVNDLKAGYPDPRARDYRISQGQPSVHHHLPQQSPHLPPHQERLHGGHHHRAPASVDYTHHLPQAYGMQGMPAPPPSVVYQHRQHQGQQRQQVSGQSPTSKPGLAPTAVPTTSTYYPHSQEAFHVVARAPNLPQQQRQPHQPLIHSKPPPPLLYIDSTGDKSSLSRTVPVSHMPTKTCLCHNCVSHFSTQKQDRPTDSQAHYISYQSAPRSNPSGVEALRSNLTVSGQGPYASHPVVPGYVSGHRHHDGQTNSQQASIRESRYYENKARNPSPGHYTVYSGQVASRQEAGYSDNIHMSGRQQDHRYPDKVSVHVRQDARYHENFHMSGRQEARYSDNSLTQSRENRYSDNVQVPGRQESRYPESRMSRYEHRFSESGPSPGRHESRYSDNIPRPNPEPYDLTDSSQHSLEKNVQPALVDSLSPSHSRLPESSTPLPEGDQPLDLSFKQSPDVGKDTRRKPPDTAVERSSLEKRSAFRSASSELPPGSHYLEYDQRATTGHHLQRLENSVDRFLPQNPHTQFRQSSSQPALVDSRERHSGAPAPSLRERHAGPPQLLHPPESPGHKSARHALPSLSSLQPSSQRISSASPMSHPYSSNQSPVGHPYSSSQSPVGLPYSSNQSPVGHPRSESSPAVHSYHSGESQLKQPEPVALRPSSHNSDSDVRLVAAPRPRSLSPDENEAQRLGVSKHEPIQNIIGNHPSSDILYLICKLCRQTYGSPYGFRKHFRNQHGFEPKAEHTIVQTISATKTAMANSGSSSESMSHSPITEFSNVFDEGKRALGGQSNLAQFDEVKMDIKSEYPKYLECPECQQLFRLNDFGSYKRHCRQHSLHRMSGPYACHDCQKCFPEPGLLQEHLETHTSYTTSVCGICQNYFSSPAHLADHIQAAHQHVYLSDKGDKSSDSSGSSSKRQTDDSCPSPESLTPHHEVVRRASTSEVGTSSLGKVTTNPLPLTKRHRQFSPTGDAQMLTVHTPKGLEVEKLPADGVVTTASPDSSYDDCQPGSSGVQVDTPTRDSESARLISSARQGVKSSPSTRPSSVDVMRLQSKDETESNSSDCSASLDPQSVDGSRTSSSGDIEKFYKHKKYSRYRKRSSPTDLTEPDKKVAKVEENNSTKPEAGISVTSTAAVTSTVSSGVTLQDCESSCQQSEDSNSSSCFKSPGEELKKTFSGLDKAKSKGEDLHKTEDSGSISGPDKAKSKGEDLHKTEDSGSKFKWDRLTRSQAGKAVQSVNYASS